MRTKIIKNDVYRIQLDDYRLPIEVDKEKIDRAVNCLLESIHQLNSEIKRLNIAEDYEILVALIRMLDEKNCRIIEDEYTLPDAERALEEIQEQLKSDNDVPAIDDVKILADEGFKQDYTENRLWQKVLEDTQEKEVVEEVVYTEGKVLHRKRTILWDATEYGRSSRDIKYEDLPTDRHLAKIIRNTENVLDAFR